MKSARLFGLSLLVVFTLILSLTGCGGGGGEPTTTNPSSTQPTTQPTPSTTTQTAYFIDSAVEGVSYTTTQGESGITDSEGKFTYTQGATITFKIGGVEIGTISNINSDKKVFIQDVVGVERDDTNNNEVLKIARFLQSLDDDDIPVNGIKITSAIKEKLKDENKILKNIDILQVETLIISKANKVFKTQTQAKLHLDSVIKDKLGINPKNVAQNGNVDNIYFGKWIHAESGSELNIDTTTYITYTASNDNLLVVTEQDGTKKSYLRASASKVYLKGQLTQRTSTVRALRDYATIGNIDVILQNILDPNIKATITTDKNGYFEDNTLPAGIYQMEATIGNPSTSETKEINTTITISDKVEELGEFVLLDKDEHNFKAELLLNHGFVLADDTIHTATIRVNNISSKKAAGVWFDIKIKDALTGTQYQAADINYTDSTMSDGSIGTIFSKSYKDIDVSFAFDPIYKNNKDTIIELTIHDADNNTWTEELRFVLYKGTFDINVDTSKSNVKGYIRLPYNDQILAIDMTKGSITLPLLSEDKHYPLVLANSNVLDGETKYSIGINSATLDFSDFKNTGAYEDDDSETQATEIRLDESVLSYIHYGDLDYWKIITQESNRLYAEDNFITVRNALGGNKIISNTITIFEQSGIATVDNNSSFILNGVDTGLSSISVKYGDKVAIKNMVSTSKEIIFITFEISQHRKIWKIEKTNNSPIANTGATQTVTSGSSVTLNGSNSTDSDGTISGYIWKEGNITLSTSSSFSKSDFSVGTHTITLIVTDDDGATASDTINIVVKANIDISNNLKKYDFVDMLVDGKNIYALVTMNTIINTYLADPDGTKSYQKDIFLLKINTVGQIQETKISTLNPQHGTLIRLSDGTIRVFLNYKVNAGTYAMNGILYTLTENSTGYIISNTTNVFQNANWGWFPKLNTSNSNVEHFSFAGYYRYINSSNQGSVAPATMENEFKEFQKAHSYYIMPNTKDDIISKIVSLYN